MARDLSLQVLNPIISSWQPREDPESSGHTEDKPEKRTLAIPLSQHPMAWWHCAAPAPRDWKGRYFPGLQASARLAELLPAHLSSWRAPELRILPTTLMVRRNHSQERLTVIKRKQHEGRSMMQTLPGEGDFPTIDYSVKTLVSGRPTFHLCRLGKVTFLLGIISESK